MENYVDTCIHWDIKYFFVFKICPEIKIPWIKWTAILCLKALSAYSSFSTWQVRDSPKIYSSAFLLKTKDLWNLHDKTLLVYCEKEEKYRVGNLVELAFWEIHLRMFFHEFTEHVLLLLLFAGRQAHLLLSLIEHHLLDERSCLSI